MYAYLETGQTADTSGHAPDQTTNGYSKTSSLDFHFQEGYLIKIWEARS